MQSGRRGIPRCFAVRWRPGGGLVSSQIERETFDDGSAATGPQGDNNLTRELGDLADKGVLVQICPNALHDQGIDPATVPTYAQTTLGGVVALVLAQHEGYAYVKP